MASLALLSSLPYSLWLAVVCWAFFEPSILGSGGDPMMRTLSGRPVPAMMGAIWMSTYYLREAPRRMSNSGPSTAEIGLGIGGCVGLFFFALIMTAR